MTDDNGGKVSSIIGLSKVRTSDTDGDEIVKKQSLPRFADHDEYGYYNGALDAATGERHGNGTMIYDSGNTYTGPFLNDKFHGDFGVSYICSIYLTQFSYTHHVRCRCRADIAHQHEVCRDWCTLWHKLYDSFVFAYSLL